MSLITVTKTYFASRMQNDFNLNSEFVYLKKIKSADMGERKSKNDKKK